MANLKLLPRWTEGVYQLEENDPVMGGENGIDNQQAKDLGNRTEWLKVEKEKLAQELTALIQQTKEDLLEKLLKQDALNKILCPPGIVTHYGGKNPPEGWLVCDGSKLKKEQYPELYAAIGDIYGSDETSFNLPEARYEFIRGAGPTLVVGTKQGDAMRNLTGELMQDATYAGARFNGSGVFKTIWPGVAGKSWPATGSDWSLSHINFDASRQVPTADEFRPRSLVLLAIIKY